MVRTRMPVLLKWLLTAPTQKDKDLTSRIPSLSLHARLLLSITPKRLHCFNDRKNRRFDKKKRLTQRVTTRIGLSTVTTFVLLLLLFVIFFRSWWSCFRVNCRHYLFIGQWWLLNCFSVAIGGHVEMHLQMIGFAEDLLTMVTSVGWVICFMWKKSKRSSLKK